ncbi:Hypothetical protein SRAE_1000056300 [Strongyloides ratti]|uniref:Uncharacterized protein n=1 Tax=Strongyloides ratti TaxID=34506 RepID=A0A090KXQ9_STRRB|nr:Hypothetical protein SRAE_1000056300 [Strongyloides ratti]CEF62290.1 Hypothetical protein SRAE_1000056300 [Strongyloides ratti]
MIGISFASFIFMAYGYLDLSPLKNIQDNEKIYGKKLLSDFLKHDSLFDDNQYIPYSHYSLKYNNKEDNEDLKRTEKSFHYRRLNIPLITKPKQTKYTRSNCFLSPVQCSFFLP